MVAAAPPDGVTTVTATLEEVRQWPATVDVVMAARPFGIGRSHAYDLIKRGQFPVRVIRVGRRLRVVTADLLAVLDPHHAPPGEAASTERQPA